MTCPSIDVDRQWIKSIKNYVTNRDDLLPPQGRFNAGQKQFYWIMYYGAIVLLISGLVMWFPEIFPLRFNWVRGSAILIHVCAALVTIGAFIIHVYMGVFMVPGGFRGISVGIRIQAMGSSASSAVVRKSDQRSLRPQMSAPPWKRRIERAAELPEIFPEAGELLKFYSRISAFQESIFDSSAHTGRTDLNAVARRLPDLYAVIETHDTRYACRMRSELLATGVEGWEVRLRTHWEGGSVETYDSAQEFFSRALLQPYAEYLARRGDAPKDGEGTCPFCAAKPVVGILRPEGEGGKRSLICSMCATEWVFRRSFAPTAAKTDKDKLPVYKAEGIGHVRRRSM